VHRLNAVGRPRGPLLPVHATPPSGWLPAPDDGPPDVDPRGPGAFTGGAEQAGDVVVQPWDDVARPGGGGGFAAAVREGVADRLPAGWRAGGGRAVPPRAALTAIAVALALVLGLVAHQMASGTASVTVTDAGATASGRPRSSATGGGATLAGSGGAPAAVGGTAGGATGAAGPSVSNAGLVVDVEGKVRHPGLVRLGPGARVADAVEAAGGPTAGAALIRINLARPLSDGEQVVVPGPDDPLPAGANASAAGGAGSGAAGPGSVGVVDVNTATQAQLDALPGVGPVLAGRIVTWRTEHGRFTSVDQLGEVSGIGDALLAKLRPLVRV
jgi:competence protein ComEA